MAFVLHRLTGVGVLAYLYLHLVVLTQLVRGRDAWDGFVAFATSPLILAADVVLLAALLFHGLNGIRVSLVGAGLVRDRRAFVLAALAATVVVACLAAVRLSGVA
jgi:succinate dehydrogenase / fumarate reductase cytochrome b subunit